MSAKTESCPMCKRPSAAEHKPFCSARCKDRDLLQWLSDGYAIPATPNEEEDSLNSGLDSGD